MEGEFEMSEVETLWVDVINYCLQNRKPRNLEASS